MMGSAAGSWAAGQQEVVALSSTEAEYISLCIGVKEITWNRRLPQSIPVCPSSQNPTTIHVDNRSCIQLATLASVNLRTKQIDVQYHYSRKAIADNIACLMYCCNDQVIADMLTQPLERIPLQHLVTDARLQDWKEVLIQQTHRGFWIEKHSSALFMIKEWTLLPLRTGSCPCGAEAVAL